MALKKQPKYKQVEGKKPVIILCFVSSIISFIGMFFGLLPITMNIKEKKAEYIANLVSETVDVKQAEFMFDLFTGIFRYVLVISIIILALGTITLFLLQWVLHRENKKQIGYFIYFFGLSHLFSFRIIESILIYRQAIKFIMADKNIKKR